MRGQCFKVEVRHVKAAITTPHLNSRCNGTVEIRAAGDQQIMLFGQATVKIGGLG
jgi:hypothetical protein